MWNVISLDGCFEGEQAWDLDFHQAAWGDELEAYVGEQLRTVGMLVFGRKTYEGMAEYWSKQEDETARYMNKLPKIVCSATLENADWNNSRVVQDAVAGIAELKQQGEGNMFVFGSGNLSESLMRANLFDEYRLCIAPVFLGKGRRLFGEDRPYQKLKLLEGRALKSGGVILRYAADQH